MQKVHLHLAGQARSLDVRQTEGSIEHVPDLLAVAVLWQLELLPAFRLFRLFRKRLSKRLKIGNERNEGNGRKKEARLMSPLLYQLSSTAARKRVSRAALRRQAMPEGEEVELCLDQTIGSIRPDQGSIDQWV